MKTRSRPGFLQRSRIDIIACILENSDEISRKTRLIYRCNLSLSQFNLYRDYMVKVGFLKVSRREDGVEMFKTTRKGEEFLKDYEKVKRILEGEENSPKTV